MVSNQQFMAVPYSLYTDDIANSINDLSVKVTDKLPVSNGCTGGAVSLGTVELRFMIVH